MSGGWESYFRSASATTGTQRDRGRDRDTDASGTGGGVKVMLLVSLALYVFPVFWQEQKLLFTLILKFLIIVTRSVLDSDCSLVSGWILLISS